MTYEEIFSAAKQIAENKDVKSFPGHLAVEIDITGEGAGAFYIELRDGELIAQPYDYHDSDCKLVASADVLTKLVMGKLDAVAAFMTGKLKVAGSVEKALEFQKLLKAPDKK